MLEPIAPEIENTIASMRSAFALGAEVVEIESIPLPMASLLFFMIGR